MTAAMSDRPLITTSHLSKQVVLDSGPLTILDDISLCIKSGETVAITGTSGSGKSTLLALLAGLDEPTGGDVVLDGVSLRGLDEDARAAARAGRVGFVFQSFQLLAPLTALENVMLPLELMGDRSAAERATALLGRVGLSHRLSHYPRQLSGGEQQRVALARAFVTRPHVLFADEPTGNLDTRTGGQVADLLFELNREQHTTLVLVTHETRLANRCQRIVQLEGGRLAGEST